MTKTDRLALAGLILYAVCTGGTALMDWQATAHTVGGEWMRRYYVLSIPRAALAYLFNIAIAVWLFREARAQGRQPYVWAAMGLFFTLISVVIFMLLPWYEQTRSGRSPREGEAGD